jgi:hypothetical protein
MRDGTRRRLLFREVNKAISQIGRLTEDEKYPLFCECERSDCGERFELPAADFEEILSHGSRFVILPGHEPSSPTSAVFIAVDGSGVADSSEALPAA